MSTYDRTRILTLPVEPEETLTYEFNNEVLEVRERIERRLARRVNHRRMFRFGDIIFKCGEEQDFISFYQGSRGNINSFNYKSLVDYQAFAEPQRFSNEENTFAYQQGTALLDPDTASRWLLVKEYGIGEDDEGSINSLCKHYKPIVVPDLTTLTLYVDGIETANYTFDDVDRRIDIPGTDENSVVTWTGEFFDIVRFDTEDLSIERISAVDDKGDAVYRLNGLALKEVILDSFVYRDNPLRPEDSQYQSDDFTLSVASEFILPAEPNLSRILRIQSLNTTLDSGRESIEGLAQDIRVDHRIGVTNWYRDEVRYILTYFLAVKGRLVGFDYTQEGNTVLSRFNNDTFSVTRVSHEDPVDGCYTVYTNSELEVVSFASSEADAYLAINLTNFTSDADLHGFIDTTSLAGSDAVFITSIYNQIVDYFNNNIYGPGSSGQAFPLQNNGTERWLNYYNLASQTTQNVGSGGKFNVLAWIDETDGIYTGIGEPSISWNTDAANYRSTHYRSDSSMYVYWVPPIGQTNSTHTALVTQFNNATQGLAPYNDPQTNAYIADISDNLFIRTDFQRNSDIEEYLEDLFGANPLIDRPPSNTSPVQAVAFLLRLQIANGEIVGFNSFDRQIVLDNIPYRPEYSIDAFAGKSEVNLSVDNGEILTLFDQFEAYTAAQMAAGILSNAKLDLRMVNPFNLPTTFTDGVPIIAGTVGQVKIQDGSITFEVRSLTELLNRQITLKTSPKCGLEFGGAKCGLDLVANGLQFNEAEATAVSNDFGKTLTLDVTISANFVNGSCFVRSGANKGLYFTIVAIALPNVIEVEGEFAGDFEAGDTVDIKAFCNKDQTACKAYNNFVNFGGIPVGQGFVPGLGRLNAAS